MFVLCAFLLSLSLICGTLYYKSTSDQILTFDYPSDHEIKNFELVPQPNRVTCGPTATLMVLKYYGKDATLSDVISQANTEWFKFEEYPIGMTHPKCIVDVLCNHDVLASIEAGTLARLKYYVSQNRPVIVLLRSTFFMWHYAIVIGYDEESISLADPSGGIYRDVPLGEFKGSWNFTHGTSGKPITCTDFMGRLLRNVEIFPRMMIVPK